MQNLQTINFSISDNGIATITLNRPEKYNSLNKQMFEDLISCIDEVYNNKTIKAVIITGAGSAFAAGADISEMNGMHESDAKQLSQKGQAVFNKIENSTKPIIAAVNGYALGGGCELALACHFRLASEDAKFGQPEVNLGLIPGYGGTQRLTQIVGKAKSMELHMTGVMLDATSALQWGLANHVYKPNELLSKTNEMVNTILSKGLIAVGYCITLINEAAKDNPNGMQDESDAFAKCFATHDAKEGIKAFQEKRKPNFTGH